MKKMFLSAGILALIFSCNNASNTGDTQQSRDEKNLDNNKKVYTAIETGNTAAIDSLIADDAVDHDGPDGREIKGKDSILHMLGDIHNHVKNIKLDVTASAAKGDYIFTMVHVTGSIDSSVGVPARKIDENGVDVVKLNNADKMIDHWGFTDDQQVMKEMMDMRNHMGTKDSSRMKK